MPSSENFDFDHWSQLARRDPAAFFAAREKLIADFIASVPVEHRESLRSMQAMIDATRAEAGSPMNAVRRMMGMMADHLDAMRGQLVELQSETGKLTESLGRLQG